MFWGPLRTEPRSWLHHLPARSPWACYVISPGLGFLMSILQIMKVALVRQFRTALSHTVTLAAGGHLNTNSLKLTEILKPSSLLCIRVVVTCSVVTCAKWLPYLPIQIIKLLQKVPLGSADVENKNSGYKRHLA